MSEPLICPDCGGVIGGNPKDGMKVCECFATEGAYAPRSEESSDASRAGTATVEKICRVCGKNLSGHRRMKDSRGYMCLACAKAEDEAQREGKVPCAECGKYLKPDGLVDFEGIRICRKCFNDHREISRFRPPPKLSMNNDHQKQSLIRLLVVAGVLLVIILLASFGLIGRK